VRKIRNYKMKANNDDGNMIPEVSVVHLMEICIDFANEMTQL